MRLALAIGAASLCSIASAALAAPEHTVYAFTDANDGGFPQGGVIADAAHNFYGTTTSGGLDHNGVVYELSPPAAGQTAWTQTTLYAFTGKRDGGNPQAGLFLGPDGVLYGTTYAGGADGQGVVFKLTPPKSGETAWTETVLWTFTGGDDGSEPSGSLIMDAAGNVYGATTGGGTGVVGTVFKLSPPARGTLRWTETVLYNFTGNNDGGEPFGNVLLGHDGNLYGTSAGYGEFNYGTLYRLIAPASGSGTWTFSLLHAFAGGNDGEVPRDGLIQAANGTLYGTTAGFDTSYGNVFELNPDGSDYQVIYTVPAGSQGFTGNGPWQTVALDSNGTLYGTTLADGVSASGEVFKLTPPAAGETAWTFKLLHAFAQNANGEYPYSKVLIESTFIYGTTYGVGGESGLYPGTVWSIVK